MKCDSVTDNKSYIDLFSRPFITIQFKISLLHHLIVNILMMITVIHLAYWVIIVVY